MEPEVDVVHSEAPSCLTEKTLSSVILRRSIKFLTTYLTDFPEYDKDKPNQVEAHCDPDIDNDILLEAFLRTELSFMITFTGRHLY